MFGHKLYIDIGDFEIKVAVLKKTKQHVKVNKVDKIQRVEDSTVNNSLLKELLKSNKIKHKKTSLVLSTNKTVTRTTEVIKMNSKDLKDFIKNNITDYFTVNTEDYMFDYTIIDTIDKEGTEYLSLLLTAFPKEEFEKAIDLCKSVGVKPSIVDIYANSMYHLFKEENEDVAVIDFNVHKVDYISISKKRLFMYANFNPEEYDDYLMDVEDTDLYLDNIIKNISGYNNFFSVKHYGSKLEKTYLIGDQQFVQGLIKEMSDPLDGDIILNELPINIKTHKKIKNKDFLYDYFSLIGLCHKKEDKDDINLLHQVALTKKKHKRHKLITVLTALTIVSGVGYGFGKPFVITTQNTYHINQLQSKIDSHSEVKRLYAEFETSNIERKNKEKFINNIKKENIDVIKLYKTLEKVVPSYVQLEYISLQDSGKIALHFTIDKTLDVAKLISLLKDSNLFIEVNVDSVKINDEKQDISFLLELTKEKRKDFSLPEEW